MKDIIIRFIHPIMHIIELYQATPCIQYKNYEIPSDNYGAG